MNRVRLLLNLILLTVVAIAAVVTNLPYQESATPAQTAPEPLSEADSETAILPAPIVRELSREPGNETSEATAEQSPLSQSGPTQSVSPTSSAAHPPLMIRWSNWRPEFGPALVYAREQDLEGMLRMQGPVEKMLMVTAYGELERLMIRADQLRAAGVTAVGLNTENGPGMTPHLEMDTLDNPDPAVNMVARAARLAMQHGFDVVWGPPRMTADSVSDATIRTMITAGVRGLALQEQKFIEVQTAQTRLTEVTRTRERYLRLAGEQEVGEFTFHVQIMHERCPDISNCVAFVLGLENIPVDSIAIWSIGPIPLTFIAAIRHY